MAVAYKYFADPDDNSSIIHQFLDENGDETGNTQFIGDYSVTPVTAYIQPPAGEVYVISHLMIAVADGAAIQPNGYGNLASLTNGYDIEVVDSSDTLIVKLNGALKINNHLDLASRTFYTNYLSTGGGSNLFIHKLDWHEDGRPVILTNQQKLRVVLNDNFTGLDDHSFYVNGYKGTGAVGRVGVIARGG